LDLYLEYKIFKRSEYNFAIGHLLHVKTIINPLAFLYFSNEMTLLSVHFKLKLLMVLSVLVSLNEKLDAKKRVSKSAAIFFIFLVLRDALEIETAFFHSGFFCHNKDSVKSPIQRVTPILFTT